MNINLSIIGGNLTRDVELKHTNGGMSIANMSVACNRKYKDAQGNQKEECSFFDVTVFGKQAESCAQYLSKGNKVLVQGRAKQETWTDKETGQNRSKIVFVADNVTFLSPPNTNAPQQQQYAPQQQQAQTQAQPPQPVQQQTAPGALDDSGIPF